MDFIWLNWRTANWHEWGWCVGLVEMERRAGWNQNKRENGWRMNFAGWNRTMRMSCNLKHQTHTRRKSWWKSKNRKSSLWLGASLRYISIQKTKCLDQMCYSGLNLTQRQQAWITKQAKEKWGTLASCRNTGWNCGNNNRDFSGCYSICDNVSKIVSDYYYYWVVWWNQSLAVARPSVRSFHQPISRPTKLSRPDNTCL